MAATPDTPEPLQQAPISGELRDLLLRTGELPPPAFYFHGDTQATADSVTQTRRWQEGYEACLRDLLNLGLIPAQPDPSGSEPDAAADPQISPAAADGTDPGDGERDALYRRLQQDPEWQQAAAEAYAEADLDNINLRRRVENSREGIPLLISPGAPHDPIRPATATEIALADRAADLEEALVAAQHLVEFLHGCLTDPDTFSYAHPDMTASSLARWAELAPPPDSCAHSVTTPGCEACAERNRRFTLRAERAARRENRRAR